MKRTTIGMALLALLTTTVSYAQAQPADINFKELAPEGFSVVVPDAIKAADAWTDVLGAPTAVVFTPQKVIYPPGVAEDGLTDGPTIALIPTANMILALHQPPPGKSYWREILDTQGEVLYRLNFKVHGLARVTRYFETKGAKLVLGDPAQTPFVNINLWPRYGFALEINELAPNATQAANASSFKVLRAGPFSAKTLDPSAFGANPVTAIAFVVPDLKQAIHDYADVWGIPEASAAHVSRSEDFPFRTATLPFPNGVKLELDQPRAGPSPWRTYLQKHGRSMFSVNYQVKSVRDAVAYLKGKGGVPILGGAGRPYAYFDFTSKLGAIIEVHQ